MLDEAAAIEVVKTKAPNVSFTGPVQHEGYFIFCVPNPDPVEGSMDPFYSVNSISGAFESFSLFENDFKAIETKFLNLQEVK